MRIVVLLVAATRTVGMVRSKDSDSSSVCAETLSVGARLPDVQLIRARIPEPGRYYHRERAIVLRQGLKLKEERRYLWHEVVHALSGDEECSGWLRAKVELSVERGAARQATPGRLLEAAMGASVSWHDFASRMKVPEEWARFRLKIAHPSERLVVVDAARTWGETA